MTDRVHAVHLQKFAAWLLALLLSFAFVGLAPFSTTIGFEVELAETGDGNLLRQIIFIILWLGSLVVFLKNNNIYEFRKVPLFILFMVWCALSVFWSQHPMISLRRVFLLFVTASSIFMLVSCLTLQQIISCLARTLALLIVISLAAVPVISGAIHESPFLFDSGLEGSWKGVFIHKNHAGPAIFTAIAVFLYELYRTKSKTWLALIGAALIFMFFSNSKTSIALLFPSLLFGYILYRHLSSKIFPKIVAIAYVFLLVVLLIIYEPLIDYFASVLDNPEAFTGRATIWEIVLRAIHDHFWLGLGYGAVWSVGEDMLLVSYAIGWVDWVFTLTHSHNGYLEVFVSLGFVGFVLCVMTFVVMPFFKAVGQSSYGVHPFMFLFFSTYLFFTLHNILETDYLNAADGRWLLILVFYFALYLKSECLKSKQCFI